MLRALGLPSVFCWCCLPPRRTTPARSTASRAAESTARGRSQHSLRRPGRRAKIDLPAAGIRSARPRPADRILRPRDLAGKPLPRRCGRSGHPQRQTRARHRPVHAGHRRRAQPAQSVRSDSGAAEIGGVSTRPAPRVRQPRPRGCGLQRRPAARPRVAGRHRPDACGNPSLCRSHHRRLGRAMGQGLGRRRPQAGAGTGAAAS